MDDNLSLDDTVHFHSVCGSRALWEKCGDLSLTDSEDSVDLSELVPLEVKIFFHARHISIGEIATIQLNTHQSSIHVSISEANSHNSGSTLSNRTLR